MRVCLFALIAATRLTDMAADLDLKERPVAKVIRLLKATQEELEHEKATDEELYEKLTCWCETNEKEKTEAIAEANRRITQLNADTAKGAGKSATLTAEIKQLEKEIAANEAALAKATEVRAKEHAEFNQNEKDMVQAIESLKNAVLVLGKHNEFLEVREAKKRQGANFLEVDHTLKVVRAHAQHAPKSHAALEALVQQPAGAGQSYAPASGQIFGILKQMKEEFEANLADSQQSEETAAAEFAELKKAKTNEINAGVTQVKEKKQQLADTDDQLAQDKEDRELTREALASDTTFLSDLKLRCQQTDKDWELRTKTRNDEIAAISETIKILTDDDAHDTFGRTLNFLQVSAGEQQVRSKASELLRSAAKKSGNMALLALSQGVKLDAFTKVKAAIDEMVEGLKKEQADEVEQKDWCDDEFNTNEKQTALKKREIEELTALIEKSAAKIDQLTKEIAQHNKEIAEMELQMKKASEDRELENKEFQTATMDQRATQEILKKALARLEVFYKNKEADTTAAALAQVTAEPGAAVAPMPEGMGEYKASNSAGGIKMLIQNIIDEAHTMEMDGIKAEADSQASYEEFIQNSNDGIAAAQREITSKTEDKANTDATKVEAEGDRASALSDAEKLAAYNAELHGSCDFLTKNFSLRQQARSDEMEALAQAKAILSGADLS
jgi:hypothetical protein